MRCCLSAGKAKPNKAARIAQDPRTDPNVFILADFLSTDSDDSLRLFDDLEDIPEVTAFIQSIEDIMLLAK